MPIPCLIDVRYRVRELFCSQAERMTGQTDRQTERTITLLRQLDGVKSE